MSNEEDFVDTGFGLAKVSDAERAKRQEIQRTRSVEGMKLRWQDQDRMELEEKAKLYAPPVISEPRCHVCFLPGSLVRTVDGFKPIEHIVIGDYVDDGYGNLSLVQGVMQREYHGDIYGLRTHGTLRPIWMTPEHPLAVVTGDHKRSDRQRSCLPYRCVQIRHTLDWSPIREVTTDSYVALTQPYDCHYNEELDATGPFDLSQYLTHNHTFPVIEIEATEDIMWMIGLYIAEGSISGGRTVNFALHRQETEYQNRLLDIFSKLGLTATIDTRENKPNSAWVLVHSVVLAEWLTDLVGVGCANKHLPQFARCMNPRLVDAMIQGIYDGDGKKMRQHQAERDDIEQTSLVLALEMIEWGILHKRPVTASYHVRAGKRDVYRVYGTTRDWSYQKSQAANTWVVDGHECVRVKSIDIEHYEGLVYNLQVAGPHTYTVENLLVHNCQHPNRLFIEQQIVKGRSASSIAQSVPPNPETGKAIDHRSIKNHYQKHMDLDSAVIRGVLDEEAQLLGQNIEEGLVGAFSIRGALNVLIRKAFDDAMAGITTVEPKDLIQMAKLYNEMDSSSATKMIEEAQSSISIFMAAIQNVFKDQLNADQAEELSMAIRQEVRRLRQQDEIEAQIENHLKQLPRG